MSTLWIFLIFSFKYYLIFQLAVDFKNQTSDHQILEREGHSHSARVLSWLIGADRLVSDSLIRRGL